MRSVRRIVQCEGIVSLAMPCFFLCHKFCGTTEARVLKLGIHMDNEFLCCGIENQAHCLYFSLYLSFFVSPAKQKRDVCIALPVSSAAA